MSDAPLILGFVALLVVWWFVVSAAIDGQMPAWFVSFWQRLKHPLSGAPAAPIDIDRSRRESHALGLPFPEADGTLSWPPEVERRRRAAERAELVPVSEVGPDPLCEACGGSGVLVLDVLRSRAPALSARSFTRARPAGTRGLRPTLSGGTVKS